MPEAATAPRSAAGAAIATAGPSAIALAAAEPPTSPAPAAAPPASLAASPAAPPAASAAPPLHQKSAAPHPHHSQASGDATIVPLITVGAADSVEILADAGDLRVLLFGIGEQERLPAELAELLRFT